MGKNIEEVRVGVTGVVAVGAFGLTTPPTDATTTLHSSFVDYGYVSEDGVTETTEQSSSKIRAWQKNKVVRTVMEEGSVQYAFTLIQTNADTVAYYYGGTVASDGSIVIDPTTERPVHEFVIDVIDGDSIIRAYAPEARVIEVGDQVYENGAPIGYEVTVECEYNDDLGGSVKKWYTDLIES